MIKIYDNTIHLYNDKISYVMTIDKNNILYHYYYGVKICDKMYVYESLQKRQYSCTDSDGSYLHNVMLEYPLSSRVDFRQSGIEIEKDGCPLYELRYKSAKVLEAKSQVVGMPSARGTDSQSLQIVLTDESQKIEVQLYYTIYDSLNIVCRHAVIKNNSASALTIHKASSACLDLSHDNQEMVYLSGGWGRERNIVRTPITQGSVVLSSCQGSTSHNIAPFVAVCNSDANEFYGNVYSQTLMYSGNFKIETEKDLYGNLRICSGINDRKFAWTLQDGESFYCPECVLNFSECGFNLLSQNYHNFFNNYVIDKNFAKAKRPILVNNWEATYFDFTEDKIMQIVETAKEVGVDMFVLDDGWFGKRDDDFSSLGDWFADKKKLPNGIKGIADKVNQAGLKFGIWIEPEMISQDSELYRNHSDYTLQSSKYDSATMRNQMTLDLSKQEVCDFVFNSIKNVVTSGNVEFIKWDYNRYISEPYSKELSHRYVLGLYSVLERIKKEFPNLLMEGCSGGGGRFDGAMLYYFPQIWTSDNTDAISRLDIQNGTSLIFPLSCMSNHVTSVPNHQTGRTTSLSTRGAVAFNGIYSLELNLPSLSKDELKQIKAQINEYKDIASVILDCDFYRLQSVGHYLWQIVAKDKSTILITYVEGQATTNTFQNKIKLHGIENGAVYQDKDGNTYSGCELNNIGIRLFDERRERTSAFVKLTKKA